MKRRIANVGVAGMTLGLALIMLSWQSPATDAQDTVAPMPPQPFGLVAVADYGYGVQLTPSVYADALISGVALRVNWSDLEPQPNTFNWATTDPVFTQAQANNKFVVLIVVPGFETPGWALQDPVTQAPDVVTGTFTRQYGPKVGQSGPLPVPWDETYLSRWYAFLQAVADRYGANPSFVMIAADGPTSVSEEMSLPRTVSNPAMPCSGSDITQWEALGYTPDKYLGARNDVFQEYAAIFPRQYASLSLADGLPIGSNATCDTRQLQATPQNLVARGLPLDPKPALQENALTDADSATTNWGYALVKSNSGGMVTGFEVGDLKDAKVSPPPPSPGAALQAALQNGLNANPNFLEVYAFDVVSPGPATQTALQETASQLPMP